MGYPQDDRQFQDSKIESVRRETSGWSVTKDDGWSLFVPGDSSVEPQSGMTIRLYGKGIGYAFRGMFLDGREVFYRTDEEEGEFREIERYGRDCADVLDRWDRGDGIWSVEMGGISPGYEQAIQLAAMEILRWMVRERPNADDPDKWRKSMADMEREIMPVVEPLGLSGAQWGAAGNLAAVFYRKGPREALRSADQDRRMQVSRHFPTLPLPSPAVPGCGREKA